MAKWRIPVFDLTVEVQELWEEITTAVHGVLKSGQFIMGENVKAFESEVAEYLGVKYAVGLNSGTDALVIALRSLGIGPGDEVITTPFSFFATAESISSVGAKPIFADIEPDWFSLDIDQVREKVTHRTKAILPVHLFGQPVNMSPFEELSRQTGIPLVEDCAQSFGADDRGLQTGTMAKIGCFSFFPSKNLGAYGDGGLLTTNDPMVWETAKKLRVHGSLVKYHNEEVGYNSRLDEIQAAILRVKLKRIDDMNQKRREQATLYGQLLANVSGLQTPQTRVNSTHVYHQYTIRVPATHRQAVQRALEDKGIASAIYYPVPIHQLPVYADSRVFAPEAERAAGEVLSLPIGRHLSPENQEEIAGCIVSTLM